MKPILEATVVTIIGVARIIHGRENDFWMTGSRRKKTP